MTEQLSPELRQFITDFCKRNKIRLVDLDGLCLDTSVEIDLRIDDFELDDFIITFTETFKIDYSNFKPERYFARLPLNTAWVDFLKIAFGYRSKWIKKLAEYLYEPKFRVRNLQRAIETGELQ